MGLPLIVIAGAFYVGHQGESVKAASHGPIGVETTVQTRMATANNAWVDGQSSRGYMGHRGHGGLTVTGINGSSIAVQTRRGQSLTITVTSATTYSEAGATVTSSALHTGQIIAVRGARSGTSGLNATHITIILPVVRGVVTAVNGTTLTLTGFDGTSHTVTVSDGTRYKKGGASSSLSAVTSGTALTAEGTLDGAGTLAAQLVVIHEPRVAGPVTNVNGSSFTVTGHDGSSSTVVTSSSTTFVTRTGTSNAAAIKVGTFIMAEGTRSADGKTLTADRVVVGGARQRRGPGLGHGNGHGGANGPGNSGLNTPSSMPGTGGSATLS